MALRGFEPLFRSVVYGLITVRAHLDELRSCAFLPSGKKPRASQRGEKQSTAAPSAIQQTGQRILKTNFFLFMAIYHLNAKVISRAAGQSSVATAAYNARDKLTDERTGEIKFYHNKDDGLIFSGIFTPKDAPEWAQDRAQLWNHAEAAERKGNATIARNYIVALPHELTDDQRRYALQDFVKENFTRKGYAADLNIHAPDKNGDNRNYHAHILVTDRRLEPDGFAADKYDRQGTKKEREAALDTIKESWERIGNRHLERHGFEPTLDRRSFEAQGIERDPSTHRGANIDGMEKRGIVSEVQERRNEEAQNSVIDKTELFRLKAESAKISREIEQEERKQETIRMYRGIGQNVWPSSQGESLFFTTDQQRAAAFGVLHYVDITAAELSKFEQPHSKRILEAEPIARNDYRTADPEIIARLQPLNEQERLKTEDEQRKQEPKPENRDGKNNQTMNTQTIANDEEPDRPEKGHNNSGINYEKGNMVFQQMDALREHKERQRIQEEKFYKERAEAITEQARNAEKERQLEAARKSPDPFLEQEKQWEQRQAGARENVNDNKQSDPLAGMQKPEGERLQRMAGRYEPLNEAHEKAQGAPRNEAEPDETTRKFDEFNEQKQRKQHEADYKKQQDGGDSSSASSREQTPEEIRAVKLERARARLERTSEERDSGNDNREQGENVRERTRER